MKLFLSAALAAAMLAGCAAKEAVQNVVKTVVEPAGPSAAEIAGSRIADYARIAIENRDATMAAVDAGDRESAVAYAADAAGAAANAEAAYDDMVAAGGADAAAVSAAQANVAAARDAANAAQAAVDGMSMGTTVVEEPVVAEPPVTLEQFCYDNNFGLEYIPDSDGGDDHKFCRDEDGVMVLEDNLQQYMASRG